VGNSSSDDVFQQDPAVCKVMHDDDVDMFGRRCRSAAIVAFRADSRTFRLVCFWLLLLLFSSSFFQPVSLSSAWVCDIKSPRRRAHFNDDKTTTHTCHRT
jgi:hypothetical protein